MEILISIAIIALIVIPVAIDFFKILDKIEQILFNAPMEMPCTLLSPYAKTPTRGTSDSAGLDLYAAAECVVPAHGMMLVSTGVAFAIPKGFYGICTGRSGITIKNGVIGQLGIIDSDYRGAVGIMMFNTTDEEFTIKIGDRVGQMVIMPYMRCVLDYRDELDNTDRGEGGFGSTGKR